MEDHSSLSKTTRTRGMVHISSLHRLGTKELFVCVCDNEPQENKESTQRTSFLLQEELRTTRKSIDTTPGVLESTRNQKTCVVEQCFIHFFLLTRYNSIIIKSSCWTQRDCEYTMLRVCVHTHAHTHKAANTAYKVVTGKLAIFKMAQTPN